MKFGDTVTISDKNPNHLGTTICAYAGMTGIACDVWPDGSFALNCGSSILVVPLNKKKGIWIELNGKLTYHKKIDAKVKANFFNYPNFLLNKLINKVFSDC